jgi:acyl carrier protein phosphodiesterase
MNFLAHAYLSFDQDEILIGNFIADFIRGKEIENYPKKIQVGIHLHRAIDAFTDSHPLVKEVQTHLRPRFGHYARVISDVFFDYFLAKNWGKYFNIQQPHSLPPFCACCIGWNSKIGCMLTETWQAYSKPWMD